MRRTPMVRTRPRPAVDTSTRAALAGRSGGWCEAQLPGCAGRAIDAAHRRAEQAGGRPREDNSGLSNVLHQCRLCHIWCHQNPAKATTLGLALEQWQDPTHEPVQYRGRRVLLDDLGGIHDHEAGAA